MEIAIEFLEYPTVEALAEAAARDVAAIIEDRVAASGTALIALPGGSTPRPIFERLAKADVPWAKVTIIPGDDRLVSGDSALSNVAELGRAFSSTEANIVPLFDYTDDYRAAGDQADKRLHAISWPPDLVWLGMGTDGHTASIFPGPDLNQALNGPADRRAIGVMPDPLPAEAPVPRVSLTRSAILSARFLMVTLRGEQKRDLIKEAIAQGPESELPIGRVLGGAKQKVQIYCCP